MVIQVPTPLLPSHLQILYLAQDRYVKLVAYYLPHNCIEELHHLALLSRYEEKKFNLGNLVFKHILGHTENPAYQKALGYPLLIFGIVMAHNLY